MDYCQKASNEEGIWDKESESLFTVLDGTFLKLGNYLQNKKKTSIEHKPYFRRLDSTD